MDIFRTILIISGSIFLAIIIFLSIFGIAAWFKRKRIKKNTIISIDFERGIVERIPDGHLGKMLTGKAYQMLDIVQTLRWAKDDPKVMGLIGRVGISPMRIAEIQELRDAVKKFRSSGKPAIAYADTFGESGPGIGAYYLATAFDTIFLQPTGDIGLTGLVSETPFVQGTLEKLGVKPRLAVREKYKSFANAFTQEKYTDAHKEANTAVIQSIYDQIVLDIAKERKLSEDTVRELVDRGPHDAEAGVQHTLVDHAGYRDEAFDHLRKRTKQSIHILDVSTYQKMYRKRIPKANTLALIYGVGNIVKGENRFNPLTGAATMGAKTIASAFRAAVRDKNVKAILFRVNSPGGSAVASDTIWREVNQARNAGKAVIVSMGGVAGSGGYYVSAGANKIVAHPATITGSIGVVSGKMVTRSLYNKLGITFDEVHTNENALLWSSVNDYSEQQWEHIEKRIDRTYDDFVTKVAEGRGMSKDDVLRVARGRIWSGKDALSLGLVDSLGGFGEAIKRAKELAKIPEKTGVKFKIYPKPKSFLKRLLRTDEHNDSVNAILNELQTLHGYLAPLFRLKATLHLGKPENEMMMEGDMWELR